MTSFEASLIFWGSCGNGKNWPKPKTEPLLPSLTNLSLSKSLTNSVEHSIFSIISLTTVYQKVERTVFRVTYYCHNLFKERLFLVASFKPHLFGCFKQIIQTLSRPICFQHSSRWFSAATSTTTTLYVWATPHHFRGLLSFEVVNWKGGKLLWYRKLRYSITETSKHQKLWTAFSQE